MIFRLIYWVATVLRQWTFNINVGHNYWKEEDTSIKILNDFPINGLEKIFSCLQDKMHLYSEYIQSKCENDFETTYC